MNNEHNHKDTCDHEHKCTCNSKDKDYTRTYIIVLLTSIALFIYLSLRISS